MHGQPHSHGYVPSICCSVSYFRLYFCFPSDYRRSFIKPKPKSGTPVEMATLGISFVDASHGMTCIPPVAIDMSIPSSRVSTRTRIGKRENVLAKRPEQAQKFSGTSRVNDSKHFSDVLSQYQYHTVIPYWINVTLCSTYPDRIDSGYWKTRTGSLRCFSFMTSKCIGNKRGRELEQE